jgi:glutamate-5-semialdehyde dehydrogenase
MDLKKELTHIAQNAKGACGFLSGLSSDVKDTVLNEMAAALIARKSAIIKANKEDVSAARRSSLSKALVDRLLLDEKRVEGMAGSLRALTGLPDPIGQVINAWQRPNGLWIHKVRVPIGVIAIIYESRPDVTADCIGLCFKSGNSVILRGGSEALHSNLAIYQILSGVIKKHGIPPGCVNMISIKDRKAVDALLKLNDYIDLVMPRGGEGLITHVARTSRIPVIKHYKGICHVYVDEWADLNMAEKICFNAKVQRPGVCNAMESMLVHHDVAARFLPGMVRKFKEAGVQVRGCPITKRAVKNIRLATEKDYRTEYLDLILSVKVVHDLNAAIQHINTYGSHHSDSIVTDNYEHAFAFVKRVDSACVYVNASTRFTDGYQFGLGAEIGISTDKLHARGPMALEELTTYKYIVFGNGQIRT